MFQSMSARERFQEAGVSAKVQDGKLTLRLAPKSVTVLSVEL